MNVPARLKRLAVCILTGVCLCTTAGGCGGGGKNSSRTAGDDSVFSHYETVRIKTLREFGSRVDWSADGRWIAYSRLDEDGFFDVFLGHPDGTDNECLTCDHPDLPNLHQGQPAFHPDGRHLVFQVEKENHESFESHDLSTPGSGYYNDLWVMDLTTREVHPLTDVREGLPPGGSLHPHFSPTGDRLLWSDLQGANDYFGDWQLAVADFLTSGELPPTLANTRYYEPAGGNDWYESHGWGPSGDWIYFTCSPARGMNEYSMDICRMDFSEPGRVTRVTHSSGLGGEPEAWDEHAQLSPRQDVFAWVSSEPYPLERNPAYGEWLKTDVWVMNLQGTAKHRVTFFNDPGAAEYQGRTICADLAWNPAALARPQLAVSVFDTETESSSLKILEFSPGSP